MKYPRLQSEAESRVLFNSDYREFIWRLLADLEAERIKIADLQSKVQAYVARVAELERRIRG